MLMLCVLIVVVANVYGEQCSAIVKLQGNDSKVHGLVQFTDIGNGLIQVNGTVHGLKEGLHGFHIHQKGDLSGGCASTGGHFNPHKKNHGAPDASERHVGDLGNIVANGDGLAVINLTDKLISIEGTNGILGRAVVVHEGEDDLGLTNHSDSKTTGNAGGRAACGVIGRLSMEACNNSYMMVPFVSLSVIALLFSLVLS